MKILINASNLHVGGGVQVASSFISELAKLLSHDKGQNEVSVFCSNKVFENINININVFNSFRIINIYGKGKANLEVKNLFEGFDICFTVFGPFYLDIKVSKHICGFAQPWIAYPDNDVYPMLNFKNRLLTKLKFLTQSFFFKRYDLLVVEQAHVKDALEKVGYDPEKISVVSNCVSSIYEDENNWQTLAFDFSNLVENVTLGFIGRPYLHKNIEILTSVNDILISKFKMKCNFLFTFTEDEMKSCGFSKHSNFYTVGEINTAQCPSFYKSLDALVFPSLLECFSASPIEAMRMNTTVIASDYPFVKEVCRDAAFYFNPLSADAIAETIYNTFENTELRAQKKQLGCQLVKGLPTAEERAVSYLNIIKNSI